jgi:transposase
MTPYRDITDKQWHGVVALFPELQRRVQSRGRPLADTRAVLNGVLWVIYSGAAWSSLPSRYPSYQTCHRRFKSWYLSGVFRRVLDQLYGDAAKVLCESMQSRMRVNANAKPRKDATPAFARVDPSTLAYLTSMQRAA